MPVTRELAGVRLIELPRGRSPRRRAGTPPGCRPRDGLRLKLRWTLRRYPFNSAFRRTPPTTPNRQTKNQRPNPAHKPHPPPATTNLLTSQLGATRSSPAQPLGCPLKYNNRDSSQDRRSITADRASTWKRGAVSSRSLVPRSCCLPVAGTTVWASRRKRRHDGRPAHSVESHHRSMTHRRWRSPLRHRRPTTPPLHQEHTQPREPTSAHPPRRAPHPGRLNARLTDAQLSTPLIHRPTAP